MKTKVLSFGEILLRISPSIAKDSAPFLLYVGGAEANTATALAAWNIPVAYCTVLPPDFMSKYIIEYLKNRGIDVNSITYSGKRVGVYYLDIDADLKSSVVYDRLDSSFSDIKPGMIDWDEVLQDVSWLNLTAISPALNQNTADVCLEALKACSLKKITTSIDLNYRAKLWNYCKEPTEVMPDLVQHCDIVMGNIWAANSLLGTTLDQNIHTKGRRENYHEHAKLTSTEIMDKFPRCKSVANTFRFDSDNNHLLYYTTLYNGDGLYTSPEYSAANVIDRSGSGDCFMAGLIYGFYNHHPAQEILDFATAAAFGKLQEKGDSTQQDILAVSTRLPGLLRPVKLNVADTP